ncbi:hypothetical protein [Pedococcus bigeumensis]|jgi:hypothetical protein|uniref:hypothetical protein n=1 Tax=Pedococcus bigeumensis TaxID=433644 RepID=UPI002FEACECE
MTENATPNDDPNTSRQDTGAPAIGQDEEQQDGGPGSHTEAGTGGAEDDAASGGVPEKADQDD